MASRPSASAAFQPASPVTIVGREREQALLRERLDAALAGRGSLVLVGGEAGIGKTALVEELASDARQQGVLVLAGHCFDLTTTPPFGPWIDASRTYLPAGKEPSLEPSLPVSLRSDEMTDDGLSQVARFEQIDHFFAEVSEQQPLVMLLEDLHWADDASLDLLRYIARQTSDRRLLLVATYRDDEPARQRPLYPLLPVLVRESRAARIDLRRLGAAAIRDLVGERYGLDDEDQRRLVAYLERRSEGNPLYIDELLRTLEVEQRLQPGDNGWTLLPVDDAGIPPLLRQVIDNRVARLEPATRAALALASIIGQDVPVVLWSTVSGIADEQIADIIDEAVEAHVLEEMPTGTGLRFSHALVREAIYEILALPRRRVWHRRVAETLAASSSASPDEVAYHFRQAGDDRAVEWFVRAGLRARRSEAWITAADRFAVAAKLLEGDDTRIRERGWLLLLNNFLLRHSNEPRVIGELDEAERIGVAAGDPVLTAYARHVRGGIIATRGNIRRGAEELEEAVAAIDSLLADHDLLDTQGQAVSVIQRLLPEADRVDDAQQSNRGQNVPRVNHQRGPLLNWIAHIGRYREVVTAGEAYLDEMYAAFGNDSRRMPQNVTCHHGMGLTYAGLGRPEEARREFALARAISTATSDYVLVEQSIWSELLLALIPYETDNIAERSRLIAEAVRAWERCRGITITTAGDGPPSELRLDVLEGHWRKAKKLATDHLSGPWVGHIQGGIVTLG
ncbi:MAG: ATP-binding protein, partial [Vicinamibacterales bacterium]